jgi:hypothetical protein
MIAYFLIALAGFLYLTLSYLTYGIVYGVVLNIRRKYFPCKLHYYKDMGGFACDHEVNGSAREGDCHYCKPTHIKWICSRCVASKSFMRMA